MKNSETKFLSEREAAEVLNLSIQTLRNWRHQVRGPAWFKLGKACRYEFDDLMAYAAKKRVDPED